ncbi:MAG TPA: GNAT family N-acetyltransferase [Acidimicrobiales bacterium]|nr:GNAT family N-acetyltransferase [Acidimicrobiales bacterium]
MTAVAGGVGEQLRIRTLQPGDAPASAGMHLEVLSMEFLARLGPRFLTAYHRAWIRSPAGLALGAEDGSGRLVGVLLGGLDPAAHYGWVLRRSGPGLALRLAGVAVAHPVLARDLIATRAVRYARALWLHLVDRPARPGAVAAPATPAPQRVGEITHLMVGSDGQGRGVGRALVREAEERARAARLARLVLVTPPTLAARGFYAHLGWVEDGTLTSRSGEEFIRFRRDL